MDSSGSGPGSVPGRDGSDAVGSVAVGSVAGGVPRRAASPATGVRRAIPVLALAVSALVFPQRSPAVSELLDAVPVAISALGGSPLLLEIALDDPRGLVAAVVVESNGTRLEYMVPAGDDGSESSPPVSIVVSPFRTAGVHDMAVELLPDEPESDQASRREYRVSFVDYRWGRDNFRFANDSAYRGEIEAYSDFFFPWVRERFGPVHPEDRALLLLQAYEILRGRMGFCYAFAGAGLLYYRHPDRLPRFNDTTYEIRERHRLVREEMVALQNDIVFDRFVSGTVREKPQDRDRVREQFEHIRRGLDRGEPVVVGILAPERHHAMLSYGYIEKRGTGEVTLIAANNWDREVRDNYSNRSVENLRLLSTPPEGPPLRWPGARHEPYREPTHILAVTVREEYHHEQETLHRLVREKRREFIQGARRVVLLEGVRSARLTDVPDSGREEPATITRINRNAILDLPAQGQYEVEVTALENDQGEYTAVRLYRYDVVSPYDEQELRVIRHTLRPDTPRTRFTIR